MGIFASDDKDCFSFGPCFITSTRTGPRLHILIWICMSVWAGLGQEQVRWMRFRWGRMPADYDRLDWTVIKISVWNVVEIVLSTELHIAVIISCVFPYQFSYFSSLILA